jgi:hypothetical protein
MVEYAFDVKLWAVARVQASSEAEALSKLYEVVDCIDIGFNEGGVKLTEASTEGEADLIEIDGKAV